MNMEVPYLGGSRLKGRPELADRAETADHIHKDATDRTLHVYDEYVGAFTLVVIAESVKGRDVTQPVAFWILNWWRTKRLGVMRVHKQTGVLSFIWLKSDRLLVR